VLRICTYSTVYPSGNLFSIHHIKRQSIYVQQPFSPGPLSTGELPNTSVHPLTRFCPAGVLFPCLDLLGPSREVARFLFGPCKVRNAQVHVPFVPLPLSTGDLVGFKWGKMVFYWLNPDITSQILAQHCQSNLQCSAPLPRHDITIADFSW
jgi:hypothetical protein